MKSSFAKLDLVIFGLIATVAFTVFRAFFPPGHAQPPSRLPSSATSPSSLQRQLPPAPAEGVCWIFSCADRDLKYAQHFHAPGFRHIHLGIPSYIAQLNLLPVWCRVGHLRDIRATGQRCVIYADDDVYLNLTQLRAEIRRNKPGSILALASPRHGDDMHINAGFIVFTDIQSRISRYVVDVWYAARVQPDNLPLSYLRDQAALNRLVKCNYRGIECYRRTYDQTNEAPKLGLLGHCLSVKDRDRPGTKDECMKRMKLGKAAPWDAERHNKYTDD